MATDLHTHALQAEEHLEALATGLAKAGVEERVVDAVSGWAKGARTIAAQLGKGQERTADDEAPEREAPAEEPQPRQTMQSATEELHRDAQAKAAERRAGGY